MRLPNALEHLNLDTDVRENPENSHSVFVTRPDFQGVRHELEIPIHPSEFVVAWLRYVEGAKAQNAFHMLNADFREFLISGLTPEVWSKEMENLKDEE